MEGKWYKFAAGKLRESGEEVNGMTIIGMKQARKTLGVKLRVPFSEQVGIISDMESLGLVKRKDKNTLEIRE